MTIRGCVGSSNTLGQNVRIQHLYAKTMRVPSQNSVRAEAIQVNTFRRWVFPVASQNPAVSKTMRLLDANK